MLTDSRWLKPLFLRSFSKLCGLLITVSLITDKEYSHPYQLRIQATVRTAKAIESAGCDCVVALLPGPEKGVDDFVVGRGVDVKLAGQSTLPGRLHANALLTAIIDDAKSLADYQRSYRAKKWGLSKYKPDVTVNVLYLSEALCIPELEEKCNLPELYLLENEQLFTPSIKGHQRNKESTDSGGVERDKSKKSPTFNFPKSGLVVLWSDMGTGKTELMRWWRDQNPDARFLNNGHRVNLLKNLAQRLRTAMYSDLGYTGLAQAQALSITIDSLHKLNTQSLTYGCIFIDEACQYLTHLLHSNTCKQHRMPRSHPELATLLRRDTLAVAPNFDVR